MCVYVLYVCAFILLYIVAEKALPPSELLLCSDFIKETLNKADIKYKGKKCGQQQTFDMSHHCVCAPKADFPPYQDKQ